MPKDTTVKELIRQNNYEHMNIILILIQKYTDRIGAISVILSITNKITVLEFNYYTVNLFL